MLILPRHLIDEREMFRQCLRDSCWEDAVCKEWNGVLRDIDPLLQLLKAPEYLVVGMPLKPGYYHLVRWNPSTFPSVTAVQTADGGFRVPDSMLLDQLRGCDLQDARVVAEHGLRRKRAEAERERENLNRREARRGEIMERWRAVSRTQVSMNEDTPWAQNHAGTRRPTRGKGDG